MRTPPLVDRLRERLRRRERHAMYDDGAYFGEDRNPLDRMGLSGYERYTRESSNANRIAYLVWRALAPKRSLDVGAALGFVVEALREVGVDAKGTDLSHWAVDHASPGAQGHVRQGSLTDRLPYREGRFDVVTAFETLEHLPPQDVPAAIANLARVSSAWVVCTIPSIGRNDSGPHGFANSKVRNERLGDYLDPEYLGPVPFDDLAVDAVGRPIEGHLTIASYRWWTAQFADAGLERRGDMERRMHPVLARLGLTEFLNLYVLAKRGVPAPPWPAHDPAAIADVERRWGLRDLRASERSLMFLRAGLGDEACEEAVTDLPG
jgi:hypothetical protein